VVPGSLPEGLSSDSDTLAPSRCGSGFISSSKKKRAGRIASTRLPCLKSAATTATLNLVSLYREPLRSPFKSSVHPGARIVASLICVRLSFAIISKTLLKSRSARKPAKGRELFQFLRFLSVFRPAAQDCLATLQPCVRLRNESPKPPCAVARSINFSPRRTDHYHSDQRSERVLWGWGTRADKAGR